MDKRKAKIFLNTIARVKTFAQKVMDFECDIDILVDRYVIDAKSIMGIFSLNLSQELLVEIHSDNEDEIRRFNEIMEEFK